MWIYVTLQYLTCFPVQTLKVGAVFIFQSVDMFKLTWSANFSCGSTSLYRMCMEIKEWRKDICCSLRHWHHREMIIWFKCLPAAARNIVCSAFLPECCIIQTKITTDRGHYATAVFVMWSHVWRYNLLCGNMAVKKKKRKKL